MSGFASARLVPSLLAARAAVAWRPALALTGSALHRAPATCMMIRRPCSSSGFQKITMPAIMEYSKGKVTKWHKKVGDELAVGDVLCDIAMEDFTIGLDVKESGFLAKICAEENKELSVGNEIAIVADTQEKLDELQLLPTEAEAVTVTTMLKAIKGMMDKGQLQKDDFAKQLLSLARHNHPELLAAFQSSIEGDKYAEETFDADFFLTNVRDIVEEINAKQQQEQQQQQQQQQEQK